MDSTDFDMIIVGAGISGINAGYRVHSEMPNAKYTILEARDNIGGTWDLFKYPGIRSDSDLHTFGFSWRPWPYEKSIAAGPLIAEYMKECAATYGIDQHIRYRHRLMAANWSSETQRWTLTVDADGVRKILSTRFLFLGTGYYNYHEALKTHIPGIESFKGPVIHPQFWKEDLEYAGKNIVIIGSGATAITLLPNMVDKAAHITMVQRSPSYVLARPSIEPDGSFFHRILPNWMALKMLRWKNIILPFLFFNFCRTFPNAARKTINKRTAKVLSGSAGASVDPDFQPTYNPWEQRMCICPDADFFECLNSGKASIATGTIENVTEDSVVIRMANGETKTIHADIIITATGLKLQIGGGAKFTVDNQPYDLPKKFLWKGVMLQDLPNACVSLGYTNASWTLGADATARMVMRLLAYMKRTGKGAAVPRADEAGSMKQMSPFNLNSTYVEKAKGDMPKAGDRGPWRARRNYMADLWDATHGDLTDGMQFYDKVSV